VSKSVAGTPTVVEFPPGLYISRANVPAWR
jgi:hypothetical protein